MQIAAGPRDDDLGPDQASQLRRDRRGVLVPLPGIDGEPHSSSPSSSTVMRTGQAPATFLQARAASKKVMSWPLLSSAPRATITFPLTLSVAMRGSNGGDFHSSSGSGGCTS